MSKTQYKAAKYIRLSYTDDKENESDSVGNQRRILDNYINNNSDIVSISEYVDDGVSGVIFNRPAFKEMMTDIESGIINCVIVKDLSRFGRDFSETGDYLRNTFPALGVRFIAIGDNIDTLTDRSDDLIVSVKSAVNDAYSRDISKKVRSALNAKRENGDYVGACPVYGYRKDDNNHNLLVIDEYPANIVRDIFRMKIDGMSALKISDYLNSLSILSPLEYKKDRDLPHPKGGFSDNDKAKWSPKTIIRILSNETYTGNLVQDRQGTLNYKLKEVINKPQSEWKRVENTHEAIISKQEYDLAQRIMRLDTRSAPGTDNVYMFSGILICDSCGGRMTRKTVPYKGEKYFYYCCPTTKKRGCDNAVNIKESDLTECVLESVKCHIINVASIDTMIANSDNQRIVNALIKQYETQIQENKRKLEKNNTFKSALYESMINNLISKDEYKSLKVKYTTEENELRNANEALSNMIDNAIDGKAERLRWMEHFKRFEGISNIDRRVVINIIKSIHIVSKTELIIKFNFEEEYKQTMALVDLIIQRGFDVKEAA